MQKLVLRFVYGYIIRVFLRIIVGVRFADARFLLKEKQFIIVANHNSHLDTMTIMASLPRSIIHKVKPVAAADHFGKTKLKAKLSNYFVNTLLIQRKRDKDNPANDPINRMVKALDDGYSLILFPEGTRGEPEIQQPLKPGVAMVLLQRPHIKYVPSYMKGMGKAMPKHDSLIVPFSSSIVFGEPKEILPGDDVSSILTRMQLDFNELQSEISTP
ncbi:lysophospholipid acyltransferase family protein [Pseudochryseolinea flava]|uniref:1-acyl-sn-glycerol-3-phosphate acyltransferase n=1 Tax=Pseudochryseolinea flava TaxID=2059302 RepID=A0A364Y194_9BACT|nr:lysophospholipid acyltransferase family protein [Pseudochryseolinea flava]RAW00371.1 1-acyl-sn-glycerol-3-phosphate acyltransferase [Pseudochryseolinea flava]